MPCTSDLAHFGVFAQLGESLDVRLGDDIGGSTANEQRRNADIRDAPFEPLSALLKIVLDVQDSRTPMPVVPAVVTAAHALGYAIDCAPNVFGAGDTN